MLGDAVIWKQAEELKPVHAIEAYHHSEVQPWRDRPCSVSKSARQDALNRQRHPSIPNQFVRCPSEDRSRQTLVQKPAASTPANPASPLNAAATIGPAK